MKKLIAKILNFLFNHGNKHPYLEEIGIHSYPANHFDGIDSYMPFSSLTTLWKQKRKFRKTKVDPRDCWEMEGSFYMWLYEHLRQYVADCDNIVDLNFYKFEHKNKTYTHKEYIEYLETLCKDMLTFDELKDCPKLVLDEDSFEDDEKTVKWKNTPEEFKLHRETWDRNIKEMNDLRKEICEVWCELMPYMWW